MEILTYITAWMPAPFNALVLGLIAFFVVVAILKLIGTIWESLPFT